ncbi:MAG TPA: class I SAM-dependent methyltransferase [Streptosporangiaceae bacterium]|nr:class I SAM-dependent methyltransferase [Streptosporangiaceae bacterium]
MALSLHQARSVYDRIGRIQDWQAFYEDATINRLVANAALAGDQTIFEFGCGTGRLAARLLGALPPTVNYLGVDISPVMINLATGRLAAWAGRAKVVLVDGSLPLPADDGFADRVLSTFVFDLLDATYARAVLDDLRRILAPNGRLCLASLSQGERLFERAISRTWMGLWRVAPQVLGGCRPISMSALLERGWQVEHHSRVHRLGLVMDVVVAAPNTRQQ